MNLYGILNSRKRAIIALVHTVFFGLIAFIQMIIRQRPVALISAPHAKMAGSIALTSIYVIVTAVLLILLSYSRPALERIYFGLCATSAGVGFLRCLLGDPTVYVGAAVRVVLLGCAVITGTLILREHGQATTRFAD